MVEAICLGIMKVIYLWKDLKRSWMWLVLYFIKNFEVASVIMAAWAIKG